MKTYKDIHEFIIEAFPKASDKIIKREKRGFAYFGGRFAA